MEREHKPQRRHRLIGRVTRRVLQAGKGILTVQFYALLMAIAMWHLMTKPAKPDEGGRSVPRR